VERLKEQYALCAKIKMFPDRLRGSSSFCNPIAIGSIVHFVSFLPSFEVISIQAIGDRYFDKLSTPIAALLL
jgi:hypothetical protein